MFSRRVSLMSLSLLAGMCSLLHAEGERWVLEGLLNEVDPRLAPDLVSGWVLSGSFVLDVEALSVAHTGAEAAQRRVAGGITSGELTVDLYHQVAFEALQRPGLAGLDLSDNEPANEGRDLLAWFIPLEGALGETDWQLHWFQVWLSDPEGRMLSGEGVQQLSGRLAWEAAWFRLTFLDPSGDPAYADGPLTLFAPEITLSETETLNTWRKAVAGLAGTLKERDARIAALETDLAEAETRVQGLRSMVDLLVEERRHLQAEQSRLRAALEDAKPELAQRRLEEARIELALLEEELQSAQARNESMARERTLLAHERDELLERLEASPMPEEQLQHRPAATESSGRVNLPGTEATGAFQVFEAPMIIERPMPVAVPPSPVVVQPQAGERESERASRRLGPRKFR